MPCDPFEMSMVHRGFQRELRNAAGLTRGVSALDRRRSGVVGEHIIFMLTGLHQHHSAEDTVLWPRLSSRAPSQAVEVERMQDAHRAIDDASAQVRATAVRWAETGDSSLAGELVRLVERLTACVEEHFDDEERDVVPLIAQYLNPKEWRKFLAHGSAFVRAHPRRGLALGGMVLDGADTEIRNRFLSNVPLPARIPFKLFGDRVYAGYRAQIYGSE